MSSFINLLVRKCRKEIIFTVISNYLLFSIQAKDRVYHRLVYHTSYLIISNQ